MQNTTGVAMVATQLAGTDRRALSEAWYRALHLAEPSPLSRHAGARATRSAGEMPHHLESERGAPMPPARADVSAGRNGARSAIATLVERTPERRAPRTPLAARFDRALRRRVAREGAAQFAVRAAGGRVQVLVRADAGRTHVVALCVPALRERVARALAHARFTLAAGGVRYEAA
jgi:hypothetical protein